MTKTHALVGLENKNSLEQIFLDLDMSIVGSEPAVYQEYSQNIRKEYSHFSDEDYRKGRSHFLKGIVDKDNFSSDAFQARNQVARENIQAEIDALEKEIPEQQEA